jgi:Tripartite tricarboxylate transporter family receptor
LKLPHRRQVVHLAAGAAALPAISRITWAQAYPARPMTKVVPYSAGGPTDTIARIMAERMRTSLGQIIIVENTTGAAGTIGVGRVARAAPDGYTISIGHWGTHVVNGAIYELQYHVFNDFEPVSLIATNPQIGFSFRLSNFAQTAADNGRRLRSYVGTGVSRWQRLTTGNMPRKQCVGPFNPKPKKGSKPISTLRIHGRKLRCTASTFLASTTVRQRSS